MSDPALVTALVPGCEDDPPCILHEADADKVLAALTAAGYAVVKLPEGVTVAHGARLVYSGEVGLSPPLYEIEEAP